MKARIKWLEGMTLVGEAGSGHAAAGHLIDGFPIAVCQLVRAPRNRVLAAESDYGYCAAK